MIRGDLGRGDTLKDKALVLICIDTINAKTANAALVASVYVPCNQETSRSLQTACHAVCRLRGHRFNELHARVCFGEIT